MEELRIDCLHQTEEELGVVKELRQNIFRLNHTMPDTEEYRELFTQGFSAFRRELYESNTIVVGNPAKLIRRI